MVGISLVAFLCPVHGFAEHGARYGTPWGILQDYGPWIVAALMVGVSGSLGWARVVVRGDAIPYVPPVAEQIAALPVADVRVRGSDQPAATPEELLRAAQAGTAEPAEELLRPGTASISRTDGREAG